MLMRFIKFTCRYFSLLNISKEKMNLNKCYFRHLQSENEIHITFLFKLKEDNFRQFNFVRKPDESISNIVTRIGSNIQKVLNKINKKKKSNSEIKEDDIKLYDNANTIMTITSSCGELISNKCPIKLQILDQMYDIVYNAPWIINLSLPQSMLAGFPIHPINLAMKFSEKEYTKFNWYSAIALNEKGNKISEVHLNWEFVSTGFTYIPTTQEIGKKIKLECIPGNENQIGPAVDVISSELVEAGPGICPFESRHLFTTSKLTGNRFRCITYNILADLYCSSDFTSTVLHPYCPPYALHIDYRKQLILKELLGYNADIACLQEVDCKIFNNILQPILEVDGFDGIFTKKGKEVAEGLTCFYRRDRFRFISQNSIILAEALRTNSCFSAIWNKIKENNALEDRLCNRSTVASVTILESIDNPEHVVIVGNTHLYFHPDADHIRLIQGGMVIYWLNQLLKETKSQMPSCRVSVILCGDFNSVPSCGIYQLYTEGKASANLPDWRSNENEAITGLTLEQDIQLGSACGTPKYTNFTAGFADCLDYIFYDKQNIQVEEVIPLPSDEELKAHTALPSIVFPSDHIALVADLSFKN